MYSRTATVGSVPPKKQRQQERLPLQMMLLDNQLLIGTLSYDWRVAAPGDVNSSTRGLVDLLDELRLLVQKKGYDLSGYQHDFLERLKQKGSAAYGKFLPKEAQDQIRQIENEQAQEQGVSLNFFEMAVQPRGFLWELLYAGDPLDDIVDPKLFWGFRYRIGRNYLGINSLRRIELRGGLFTAIHDGLDCSKREVENLKVLFAQFCSHLRISGSAGFRHLRDLLAHDCVTVNDFIKHLVAEEFNYGIAHFACHCENPQDAPVDDAFLSLTVHGKQLHISLEKLISLHGHYRLVHKPFIFLNACESATPGHIMHRLNFPTGMLHLGASGVIATTCVMPDNFASAFAAEFYRRLLNKESPTNSIFIGEALLETRLHFLEKYNNPLGLAYGLYAVSDQELRYH